MATRGRPSLYTPELAARICERLAAGESLRAICRGDDMPSDGAVRGWVNDHPEFAAQYAYARDKGLDAMADELLQIADDGTNDFVERETENGNVVVVADHEHINRSRLRVDTRKWYLSKLAPKRYGERLAVEHSGSVDIATRIVGSRKRAGTG